MPTPGYDYQVLDALPKVNDLTKAPGPSKTLDTSTPVNAAPPPCAPP